MHEQGAGMGKGWRDWMPGLRVLQQYQAGWLRHDIASGLALAAVLVPVGIAYAIAAGLPGIHGLYATIVPLLAYALFGPSRILVVGPDSALAAIILVVVLPLSGGDPARAAALAGAMAIVSGITCVLAGIARLGFVTELLSKPIRYGYMNGIALTVVVSQLPALFGFDVNAPGVPERFWGALSGIWNGSANAWAVGIGLISITIMAALRKRKYIPATLVAVAGTTALAQFMDLGAHGVAVLGTLPQGLPAPVLPLIAAADIGPVVMGGVAAAVLSFAETSILSRSYGAKLKESVEPNEEAIGLGAANLAAGLFQGFPVSSSASRTPVAEATGARTQLACVVGALAVSALLMFAPGLLRHLPASTLAAVVIFSAAALFEVTDLKRIYRIQRWEFWLSIGCAAGVVLLGPVPGIGLAIVAAIIEFLWDGWRPHVAVLGRVHALKGYHDITRHPDARQVPGLLLFRWDAPLFFANAEWFHRLVEGAVNSAPTPIKWLVVAAEPVTSVDVTSADMLAELDEALAARGITLVFAEMKDPVKDKLKRFGLFERFGERRFFPTLGQAVSGYLASHDVPWVDWEDAVQPNH
ncbi:SulP family inorganic anion transporter [Paracandidimonas lactea]|uniref:SulP family inorganic anion transporter n=1 Tax=Paracandidimonas lactea TaxID=2895524 RepID=UPI001F17E33B|nr:SulP family inorganic anion transporter [Paracandidimonas lactea]